MSDTQAKKREIKILNPDADLPTFYVNYSETTASTNLDVRLRLGQLQEGSESLSAVKRVADVYMSAKHAKSFAKSLTEILAKLDEVRDSEDS